MILTIIFNYITEPKIQALLRKAEARQDSVSRPGTENNNRAVLKQFIRFLCNHGLSFRLINEEIICAYIENLVHQVRSPATVRNYLSALTVMYQRMNLNYHSFYHHRVLRALKGTDKDMRHIPMPANLVTPALLKSVIYIISHLDQYYTLRFLMIGMFMSMLRQSNFLAPSVAKFDPTRQLTRNDVTLCRDGVHIMVKWEKNMQSSRANEGIVLPPTIDSALCPVRAYRAMMRLVPTKGKTDALIMFSDYNPMTLSFVQGIWKGAMEALGKPTNVFRLHGLRRGGATYIASASPGARRELQDAGRWRSTAYQRYVANPTACATYEALSTL